MANVLNVKPTKVELQRLKNQLALAQNGYDLLKNKQDELMRQFIGLIRKNNDLRKEVEEQLTSALKSFVMSKSMLSEKWVDELTILPSQTVTLDIREENIMSVIVPKMDFNYEQDTTSDFEYGYLNSNAELDKALLDIQEVLPSLLELSEIEKTTQMLADEIEGTRRRVNALEHKMIPETAETIKYIEMKIAESQRETVSRMIKIKDL
ncbi:MAG: V-type ATP synthase subunit D [Atopococcus tabaci]|uniref:V-type ATP synthase subunit D n=1 Tax=Atopococcus tabaci TaxID=269774 RepID=A0AA43UC19_9LACT|nr:V-type ATP synthase subunit D [Atopococcus tabaci]